MANFDTKPQSFQIQIPLIISVVVGAVVLVTGLMFFVLRADFKTADELTDIKAGYLARFLGERAASTMLNTQYVLTGLHDKLALVDPRVLGTETDLIDNYLQKLRKETPYFRSVSVVNRQAGTVYHSGDSLPIDPADNPDIQMHIQSMDSGFFVGDLVRSGADGQWVLPVSLPTRTPDGHVQRIVVAMIDVALLSKRFENLVLNDYDSVTLVTESRQVLLRVPHLDVLIGRHVNDPVFIEAQSSCYSQTELTVLTVTSPFDGSERSFTCSKVPDYGLLATASVKKADIDQSAKLKIGLTVIGCLLVMASGFLAAWRLVRNHRNLMQQRHKMEQLATTDMLTGLPNRSKFAARLNEIIKGGSADGHADRGCVIFSVLLDRMKVINDSIGVRSGDTLIREVALRLRQSIGAEGYLARLDTESFAVSMQGVCDQKAAESIALIMKKAIEQPFVIDGQEVHITLSVGVAFSTDDVERADEMLQAAGLALATARSKGHNSLAFFEDAHRSGAQDRLKLENDLRRALRDGGQLEMFFQPVMNLSHNQIAGFEALMRWNHPDRGLVSPGVFIPIAEESDLVVPMGKWALQRSARQLAQWHADYGPDLFISVNVSGRQLYADDLVQVVKDVLKESGLPPQSLKLEITETVLMNEPNIAIKVLNEVRALGVRLGIDDFGTGYSSLSYLQQLPADVLKIDRAFVQNMADSAEDQQIVKTIADLGHNLGMELIAEGIERENEVPLLRQYGCDLTQGFLFARPMPADEASAFLRKTNMTKQHGTSPTG